VARIGYEVYYQYDPSRYEDVIRPVLQRCIERGISLDINASGLRRPVNRLMPGIEILRWYVEMGGERVIFSSDAHQPRDVGTGIQKALEAARTVGISHTYQYDRRQARRMMC